MIRTYSELIQIVSFEDRFDYLKLSGRVAEETFGWDRYFNQQFYRSPEWKRIRDYVAVRDFGCDLAHLDYEIFGSIIVHHMNPISLDDIRNGNKAILDPEYLVATTKRTHNAIHYGDKNLLPPTIIARSKNDTCPWK